MSESDRRPPFGQLQIAQPEDLFYRYRPHNLLEQTQFQRVVEDLSLHIDDLFIPTWSEQAKLAPDLTFEQYASAVS